MTYNKVTITRRTAKALRESPREKRARKAQFFMVWRSELRAALQRKEMTNVDLSRLSGKDKGALTRFFNGGDAKLSTLLMLSEALGMKWRVPKLEEIEDVIIEHNVYNGEFKVKRDFDLYILDHDQNNNMFINFGEENNYNCNVETAIQERDSSDVDA